ANVENYVIEDDTTDARTVTINSATMHVTANSVTDAVTFYLGALTFTGTIIGEATVDDTLNLLSLGTGADVSGGTIANVEALALASGATVHLSAAQNQEFIGAIAAPGTGIGGETIMITGDGAVTTLANVENYAIDDDTTDARTVTVTQANTHVTATSSTDAVTFNLDALAYTGTIIGESTVDDTLSLSTGADVSGGTIASVEALTLSSGASVRLSVTQNQGFSGAITASGSGIGGETVMITGDGAVTTLANIEKYNIEDDSTNARIVTISQANTGVTANSASDAVAFNVGALMYTGSITGNGAIDDTLSLAMGADVSGGTIANVEALTLASRASVRLTAAQNQGFTGAVTAPGTGVNGETITITGDGAVTTLANVENYIIEDDSTDARTVMISSTDTHVTANSITDAVTFYLGALIFNGTIIGEATVDDALNLLSLGTGADVSGGTIENVEALVLATGASVRLSVAQNQGFIGAITAPGTGVNGELITIVGDGAVTTLAEVENYTIDDDSTNARTVMISSADTNVTANSITDAITFDAGALAYTGTITGESSVDDTLSLDNGADISGGTVANVEALTLTSGASVRLSAVQNQGFIGAITAPGTGIGGETITVTGDGAVITLANVENYNIENDTTNMRAVTITQANTNVTAVSNTDAVMFVIGAQTYTGAISGEAAVDDTLSLDNGADVSGGTVANIEALTLTSGASIRLSASQNQGFTGVITAPGTGIGGETITVTGNGAVTTLANIENYSIEDDSTDARTVTISQADTNVTAASNTDAVTFAIGAQTYTGVITGESSVDDTLSLDNGADVSGGTVVNVEALTLASGASVRLSAAQNQAFTGAITASGTSVNGEEITIVGDGGVSTLTNVENYVIEDDSTNARAVTIIQANTNVTATSTTDTVTFAIGAQTYTGAIMGEAAVDDTLSLDNGADVSGGTVANVEALTLTSGASVRL
ncbi:hypothetical protein ABF87_13500, partial [Nitrosomonas sp. JL21]|nr:hypothetical protein [Nitrosomonas sp. JL21]